MIFIQKTLKNQHLQQQYDLVLLDQEYIIYFQDQPLKTRGGEIFSHTNDRLMKHLLTEFQTRNDKNQPGISYTLLFEFQKDHLNLADDFLLREFEMIAKRDPFILLKTSGEKETTIASRSVNELPAEADDNAINLAFWSFSSILKNLNIFIEDNIGQTELLEDHENPLILLLKQQYIQSSSEKKTAIQLLYLYHQSGFVLPMLFVSGKLTVSEYAKGVLALHLRNHGADEKKFVPFLDMPYQELFGTAERKPNLGDFFSIFQDGAIVLDYLSYFLLPASSERQTREMIAAGESSHLEFKSTLRWDLRAGKTNQAVERASLKTLCAFLNATGGTLIIGVRDDGSIEGIESDRLLNDDRFLLHLWTLIRTCLGRDVSPYIQTSLEKINEKTICVITCSRSLRPIFLRQPGFEEEFYIRLGPSSASLDISEALKYIADRFE